MLRISGYCLLSGDTFSPAQFEKETGFLLRQKTEPGQVGVRGKYNGVPVVYGSAILDVQQSGCGETEFTIEPNVKNLLMNPELLAKLGVSMPVLHFDVEYVGQCNLEFSTKIVSEFFRLAIPITLTCYEADGQTSEE